MGENTKAITVISASRGWSLPDLREVWAHRALLLFLCWRDVKVRYKQTLLGFTWAILQPLATMLIFTVVFDRIAGIDSGDVPYPVFSYAALLPWMYFASSVGRATSSLVGNTAVVTKVYFPRLLLPASSVLGGLVDFAVSFAVLLVMMVFYGIGLTPRVIVLPLLVVLTAALSLGVGLCLAGMNARFRDVGYAVPLLTQLWLFATPVAYPTNVVPGQFRAVLAFNPMTGIVDGFRWALLDQQVALQELLLPSFGMTLLVLALGLVWFRRMERMFVDVV